MKIRSLLVLDVVTRIKIEDLQPVYFKFTLFEPGASICDLFRIGSDYPVVSERQPLLQETKDITTSETHINCLA
jgi:hypothetical protein